VRDLPLVWRIFVLNASVFAIGVIALAVSPATVSFPIVLTEALVLSLGLVAILFVNLFLLRRSLEPLQRLMALMRRVDPLRPGERVHVEGSPEVRALGGVFNEMLDRLERERRDSGRETLSRLEGERKRVAQELHDELGQSLTGIVLVLSRLADRADGELRGELLDAQEAMRATLDDVRSLARRLRPEALDDLGLVPALNALIASFAEASGLRIERSVAENLPELTADAELAVFRIAQESLTNAARHAHAHNVQLELRRANGNGVRLHVRDDGVGLAGAPIGRGIRGMQERALHVGGRLELFSPAAGGVEVRLTITQ
jgi:two-component system, NarL family, sensor histidine kinase UhpB